MNQRKDDYPCPSDAEFQLEETEALIWDLLDDRLDDASFERLARMLETNPSVRTRYIESLQLHVDLQEHFGRQALEAQQQPSGTVVLPDLFPGLAGLPGFPTVNP